MEPFNTNSVSESPKYLPDKEQMRILLRHLKEPMASLDELPWVPVCLLGQKLQANPNYSPHMALQSVLTDLLSSFGDQEPTLADLLRGRYWEGHSVTAMLLQERPERQSERRFYTQQNRALYLFALWLQEQETRCQQAAEAKHLLRCLPFPTYRKLFGVEDVSFQVMEYLKNMQEGGIISIRGIGGMGKTTVADYAIRKFIQQEQSIVGLVWISAKQQFLTESGILGSHTQIDLLQIFDELGHKLGIPDVVRWPLEQKVDRIASMLRKEPYLVVIDNLETVKDFQRLIPWLHRLGAPTRFVLTSRETVPSLASIYHIALEELSKAASLALIEHIAQEKGTADFDPIALYELVGGNPLAIILAVSQMRYLPPMEILEGIHSGAVEDLYTFVFWRSWSVLNTEAREVLFAIQRAGDQLDWQWLSMVFVPSNYNLQEIMQQLIDLSLVQPQIGEGGRRIYTIHRLTSTFLQTEVLGWR